MTERFYQLEKCFAEKAIPEGMFAQITDQGIGFFGDLYYVAGESLDENLRRYGYADVILILGFALYPAFKKSSRKKIAITPPKKN